MRRIVVYSVKTFCDEEKMYMLPITNKFAVAFFL